MLKQFALEAKMHPKPLVIQPDPQVLHYVSVLYVAGAPVHKELLAAQAAGDATVPVP